MASYIDFSAAIYDPAQPDTSPADISSITPGSGVFTPGGRDILKNIAGHMIANGKWTLSAVGGTDPATYTLSCDGPGDGTNFGDSMTVELSWDVIRANIQLRMGTSFANGSVQNVSSFQLWPVTNGASAVDNNARAINVFCWADKESVCIVVRDLPSRSNYTTAFAFGLLKRWPSMIPTAAGQLNKDYTAIFYTIPTRASGEDGAIPTYGLFPTYGQFYGNNHGYGPTANGYNQPNMYTYEKSVFNAIRVYQNYGDTSASWVINHLSSGGMVDTNFRNATYNNDSGASFGSNLRQPLLDEPRIGTDGLFHLQREIVYQMKTDTDVAPVTRGTLPGSLIYVGKNAGNDGTIINAGTEQYMVLDVNLGFWLRMNPGYFAIRKA